MHCITSKICANNRTVACPLNSTAFSNSVETLAPRVNREGRNVHDKLGAIIEEAPSVPDIPLHAQILHGGYGHINHDKEPFAGSLDVSMFLLHLCQDMFTYVTPTRCPIFTQHKDDIMSEHRHMLPVVDETDNGSVVESHDDADNIDEAEIIHAANEEQSVPWVTLSLDRFACLPYIIGARHLGSDPLIAASYHIYVDVAKKLPKAEVNVKVYDVSDYSDPVVTQTTSEIKFNVAPHIQNEVHIDDTILFYNPETKYFKKGIVKTTGRSDDKKSTQVIFFHGMKKATMTTFIDLWKSEHPPTCFRLVDMYTADMSDVQLLSIVRKHLSAKKQSFPAFVYGITGEIQPCQPLITKQAIMIATIIKGENRLIVDDMFYVSSSYRTQWRPGDHVFMIMKLLSKKELPYKRSVLLPEYFDTYELIYIKERDLEGYRQYIIQTPSQHSLYYKVYIGLYRETAADTYYACCELAQSAIIENDIDVFYDPTEQTQMDTRMETEVLFNGEGEGEGGVDVDVDIDVDIDFASEPIETQSTVCAPTSLGEDVMA